ncbi:MAG: chemotaxis protein CheA [Firmicutes bacterium]|nr:chemotaxis protein CheA [Bacillota bacterium]
MDLSPGISAEDIQVFLEEADEQIQLLEDDLVRLEQEDVSDELLQEIFRAAHTLKGSSATLGHRKMAELTHAMENAFDRLRKGTLGVSGALMDVLFEALDALTEMKEDLRSGSDTDIDVSALVSAITDALDEGQEQQSSPVSPRRDEQTRRSAETPERAFAANQAAAAQETAAAEQAAAAQDAAAQKAPGRSFATSDFEEPIAHVTIKIDPDCPMPAVRAFQIVDLLATLGEIIESVPSLDEIEAGNVDYDLEAWVRTDKSGQELEESVQQIADLVKVSVATESDSSSDLSSDSGSDSGGRTLTAEEVEAPPEPGDDIGEGKPVESNAGGDAPAASSADRASRNGAAQTKKRGSTFSTTVRVDVARLDTLMNLVAELVIDRAHLAQIAKDVENRYDRSDITEALDRTALNVGRATSELQDEIMKIRMLPIDNVFRKFPRMVRDLSQELGKDVNFVIEGQDTELDRSVIEEIGDPLIHLLRNAVGHGIEPPEERLKAGKPRQGMVRLKAYHQENSIVIEVEDDGRGIDPEKVKAKAVEKGIISSDAAARLTEREAINLIFASGLSTAATVDGISGRGVGMDIVRTNIERLNGSIFVDTRKGLGTRFVVKMPLTLAIIRAQLVSVGGRIYAIPIGSVQINLREPESSIRTVRGQETYVYGDRVLPIIRLSNVFGVRTESANDGLLLIVVVQSGNEQVGLVVDKLMGQQEIVIKNLSGVLGDIHGLSGVTILGDGRLALILDIPSLIRSVSTHEYAV